MQKVKHEEVGRILRVFYDTKDAVMLHGAFGIGKTAAVRRFAAELAKELGLPFVSGEFREEAFSFVPVLLHQFEVGELKGIPFPNESRDRTIYLPALRLPRSGAGVLFFDEVNLAPPLVQNTVYQIALDRQLCGQPLPEGYMVVAAGNRHEDGANTFDMPKPLQNRFFHFLLVPPTAKEWAEYAVEGGVDHRVVNFLLANSKYMFKFGEENYHDATIPTPRMWEKVGRAIIGIKDPWLVQVIVAGAVGEGIGIEFTAFLKMAGDFDIEKIFTEQKVNPPKDLDALYALISAVVGYYLDNPTAENAVAALRISQCFLREHMVMLMSQIKSKDPELLNKIKKASPQDYKKFVDEAFDLLV